MPEYKQEWKFLDLSDESDFGKIVVLRNGEKIEINKEAFWQFLKNFTA